MYIDPKCPNCKRGILQEYKSTNYLNNTEAILVKCDSCNLYHKREYDMRGHEINIDTNCFTLEFSCVDGNKGSFTGLKDNIHKQIDAYEWSGIEKYGTKENQFRFLANTISILKYGYCYEFKDKDYDDYNMTVDNGLSIIITKTR